MFHAEWYASDALSFYGTILASITTIMGVYLSIDYAQKNYREDESNRVRPYFALTHLKSKSKYNWLDDTEEIDECTEDHKSARIYEEYKPERIFIILKRSSINYKYELTQKQKDILETGGMKWQEIGKGARALTSLEYISLPFEIENVGNGTALCLQLREINKRLEETRYSALWLHFNYDDIRYLIVPDSHQRIKLIEAILEIPEEMFSSTENVNLQKQVLISKILVLDEIRKDW